MSEKVLYKIKDISKDERPRERLRKYGAKYLSNTELFAILISSGTKTESALMLAGRVLNLEQGNLSLFSNYLPEEFEKVSGIGEATSSKLCAAIELGKRINASNDKSLKIVDTASAAELCKDLIHLTKEIIRVVMLDASLQVIMLDDVAAGNITSAGVYGRELFQNSIKKGASAIILVHNHPSGNPYPSEADADFTKSMIEAGNILNIPVLDHIVIGNPDYFSFKENNLLF